MPNGGLTSFLKEAGISGEAQALMIASVIALMMLWAFHTLVQRVFIARIKNPTARFSARRVARYVAIFAAVFIVGRIWYSGFQSVATIVGLLGAGIAIALKDPLTNLAGWVFLVVRHPFRIGDRIHIGDHMGDVVDVGLFQFQLHEIGAWLDADQPTGRVIYIPNARVFSEPQINYHHGLPYIFDDVLVNLTFESNWQKAKMILAEIGRRHALPDPSRIDDGQRRPNDTGYFLLGHGKDCEVFTSVRQNGVRLMLRYTVDARQRTPIASAIWEEILQAFALHEDIRFAYRTYRRVELGSPALDRVPREGERDGSASQGASAPRGA